MPAPKTTTTPKTYTATQIEKMAQQVRASVLEDMAESSFLAAADMVCKVFIKRLKEGLK